MFSDLQFLQTIEFLLVAILSCLAFILGECAVDFILCLVCPRWQSPNGLRNRANKNSK